MVVSAEEGWTSSSLSVWKILGPIEGSWDVRSRCPLPIICGHSVPLNQARFSVWAAGSAQLFSYDKWSVGCLHLRCCCFLWRRWGAALEAGNAALAGKHFLFLHFLYVLTREYDFKAEVQEICLPGFILTTSCSGLDPWPRQHNSGCRRLNRTMGKGRGLVVKKHPIGIQPARNCHHQ